MQRKSATAEITTTVYNGYRYLAKYRYFSKYKIISNIQIMQQISAKSSTQAFKKDP